MDKLRRLIEEALHEWQLHDEVALLRKHLQARLSFQDIITKNESTETMYMKSLSPLSVMKTEF